MENAANITQLELETDTDHLKYPSLLKRIQSLFIDNVMVILATFAISFVLERFNVNPPAWFKGFLLITLFVLYEPLCVAFGCTIGNKMMGIRARRLSDESKRISLPLSFLRFGVKIMLGWLSFLTIGSNPKKRAIHDMASGSVMINVYEQ